MEVHVLELGHVFNVLYYNRFRLIWWAHRGFSRFAGGFPCCAEGFPHPLILWAHWLDGHLRTTCGFFIILCTNKTIILITNLIHKPFFFCHITLLLSIFSVHGHSRCCDWLPWDTMLSRGRGSSDITSNTAAHTSKEGATMYPMNPVCVGGGVGHIALLYKTPWFNTASISYSISTHTCTPLTQPHPHTYLFESLVGWCGPCHRAGRGGGWGNAHDLPDRRTPDTVYPTTLDAPPTSYQDEKCQQDGGSEKKS